MDIFSNIQFIISLYIVSIQFDFLKLSYNLFFCSGTIWTLNSPNGDRYIYPVLDVDFVYGAVASSNSPFGEEAKPVLVTVFPFNTKGSLKDLIYRVRLLLLY